MPRTESDAPTVRLRVVFRRFWPLAREQRRWFGVMGLLLVVSPLLSVLAIWCWKLLVDDVLVPRDFDELWPVVLAFVALTLAGTVLRVAQDYLATWLGETFLMRLRSIVFRHLQSLSSDFYTRRGQGDVQLRLNSDITSIQIFVLSGPTSGLAAILQVLFFTGALLVVQWQLALLTLAAVPILALVTRRFARLRQAAARERRRCNGAVASVAEDALHNTMLVQCCSREEHEADRVDLHGRAAMRAQLTSARYAGTYTLLVQAVELVGSALVIGVGAWMLAEETITLGGLLVFLAYLAQLFSPIRGLGKLATTLFTAGAAAERVLDLLDQEPAVSDQPGARSLPRAVGRIALDGVSYRYDDSARPALEDVSFTAEPGEIVALVGPSGAGKSTLARLLVRFCDPDSGAVNLDGHDLRDLRLADVRRNTALLLQDAYLLDTSVSDNIGYADAEAGPDRILDAALAADVDEFVRHLPSGYDSRVGHSGRRLSGGQRQRVAIARTLLQDAPVIVLDEPGTALDVASLNRLMGPLRRLVRGRTTIVISHNLLLTRDADRIFVLDQGRIVDSGTHEALLGTSLLYAELWRLHQHDSALVDPELAR